MLFPLYLGLRAKGYDHPSTLSPQFLLSIDTAMLQVRAKLDLEVFDFVFGKCCHISIRRI
jgi:hypothetical protein